MKKSFLIYQDWEEVFDSLTDNQAGKLIKAMFDYSRGEKVMLKNATALVFISLRQNLDRMKSHYEKVCEINRENAKKRWNQPQNNAIVYDRMRPHAKAYDKDKDKDKDINNKEIYKESKDITSFKKKYTSLKDLDEGDFQEIAEDYKVPIAFIRSCFDDLENYCQSHGKTYKDYKAALRNFVKNGAIRVRKEANVKPTERGIDASNI
jgi:hypothetical protein